jgi:hypothetical protein
MLIDKETGQVNLGNDLKLFPKMRLTEFQAFPEFEDWKLLSVSGFAGNVYEGTTTDYKGRKVTIKLCFRGGLLRSLFLSYFLPDENQLRIRWFGSSDMVNDAPRWTLHEKILREELGSSPCRNKWGYVTHAASDLDPRGQIAIFYSEISYNDPNLRTKGFPPPWLKR